jgi:DMSO reductase family type II enzyme heme b subunit
MPKGVFYPTGRAAGNPLSDRIHVAPIEDLNAAGFGTLTSQPGGAQNVKGNGRWADGRWSVVFIRHLESGQSGDIQLQEGQTVSLALAIWDGQAGDRDGQKSISLWQRLTLEK